jgi:FkbM family methyltransferase
MSRLMSLLNWPELLDTSIDLLRPLHFPGKVRLLDKFVPKTGERCVDIFGGKMRLDLSDHGQRWIYLGNFEPEETRWVKEWLRLGMTVVDVGANVGYYTMLAASCVGRTGKVYSVEPSPYASALLHELVARNALTQVVIFQSALGRSPGNGILYSPPEGNHSPSMVPSDHTGGTSVPVNTLDDCLRSCGIEQVDLLKIDVEGFEPQVLAGAKESLGTGKIRAILCELNDWWLRRADSSAAELYNTIISAGFSDAGGVPKLDRDCFLTRFFVHSSVSVKSVRRQ